MNKNLGPQIKELYAQGLTKKEIQDKLCCAKISCLFTLLRSNTVPNTSKAITFTFDLSINLQDILSYFKTQGGIEPLNDSFADRWDASSL